MATTSGDVTESEVELVDVEDILKPAKQDTQKRSKAIKGKGFEIASAPPAFLDSECISIREHLLRWYHENRRKLPWRLDAPPYNSKLETGSKSKPKRSKASEESSNTTVAALDHTELGDKPTKFEEDIPSRLPCWMPKCDDLLEARRQNAYGTWVSEIMLQQTRVDTVIDYYLRWMQRFPTVHDLAAASLDDVNKLWAGLGYYRRAENLWKGAKQVVDTLGGIMPTDVEGLKSIPGIGDYTAGAIASIAFHQPVPLVDGNVVRVLSRLRAWEIDAKSPLLMKDCWRAAGVLVDPTSPGDFNQVRQVYCKNITMFLCYIYTFVQAMMELGATVCTPGVPNCGMCPLRKTGHCKAYETAKEETEGSSTPSPSKKARVTAAATAQTRSISSYFGGPKHALDATVCVETDAIASSVAIEPVLNMEVIGEYIANHYPLKPAAKEAKQVSIDVGVLVVVNEATGSEDIMLLRDSKRSNSSSSAKDSSESTLESTTFLEGNLLAGQWHPVTALREAESDAQLAIDGALQRLGLRIATSDNPLMESSATGTIHLQEVARSGPFQATHIFSHRKHNLTVFVRKVKVKGTTSLEDLQHIISNTSKSAVEAIFTSKSKVKDLGITTWLTKILQAAGMLPMTKTSTK